MRHSTSPKYIGATSMLMHGELKVYPNGRVPRYAKNCLLPATNKEASKAQAKSIASSLGRQVRELNDLLKQGKPANKARRISICKEYLTEEKALELDEARNYTIWGVAGWYFWMQDTPSQDEYFDLQYQEKIAVDEQAQ